MVESKIRIPVPRAGTVSRTALVNRLRATGPCPVVTVVAPAGYGKTTLLAQLAARDPRPVAWITVDERDADPVVLLRHLAAALDRFEALDPSVPDALAAARDGSIWASVVPRLGGALAEARQPLLLVIDDAHALRSRESLNAVGVLADNLSKGSTMVLAGRSMPRVPAASLRVAGKLLEVDADDLALTPREGQLLFRGAGADLSLSDATELVRRCEGWPAALYLAATSETAGEFNGRERHVADYLRSECLSRLRPGTLRFLRRTSVLSRMSASLCDAVLDDDGSAHELEKIERSNLFVVPLDREGDWFRYHRLFGDLLRQELTRREPSLVPVLHRRAAAWHEAHGDPESAFEHARAAGDLGRAARVLAAIALPAYSGGRAAAVEGWLAHFDDPALLRRHPGVALQGAWVHALRGRSLEAQRRLRTAEQGRFRAKLPDGSTSPAAWIAVLNAALCRDGVPRMLADAETGLAALPESSLLRPFALVVLGAAHVAHGDRARGDGLLAAGAAEAERVGATDARVVALGERSLLASARSDHDAAEELARTACELAADGRVDGYTTSAIAYAAFARACLRHGRGDDARAQLAQARRLAPSLRDAPFPWLALQTHVELARASLALRDAHAVRSELDGIEEFLRDAPDLGVLVDDVRALAREADGMHADEAGETSGLTAAELRVLPLLATHRSFREIGQELFVSRNTVKTQAISVYRKLGVSSRSEAVDRAVRLGLVRRDDFIREG